MVPNTQKGKFGLHLTWLSSMSKLKILGLQLCSARSSRHSTELFCHTQSSRVHNFILVISRLHTRRGREARADATLHVLQYVFLMCDTLYTDFLIGLRCFKTSQRCENKHVKIQLELQDCTSIFVIWCWRSNIYIKYCVQIYIICDT